MAYVAELEEVEAELQRFKAGSVPPAEPLSRFLRLIRDLKIRDSYPVARYGSLLLEHHRRSLPEEELWLVYEQVAIAALDSGATEFAASIVKIISERFPLSSRTRRLQGMFYEAQGNIEKAVEIYEFGLVDNPTDEDLHKRRVAAEKSRGQPQAAIEALKKYLDVYANDKDAWEEMADLYLQLLMYKQALFCYEELLLFAPNHPNYLVRYADILFTLGGASNYRLARSYYAKAVEASAGRSVRALYGILACYNSLAEKVSLQDSKTRAQIELPDVTAQVMIKLYKKYAPDKLKLLEPFLPKDKDAE